MLAGRAKIFVGRKPEPKRMAQRGRDTEADDERHIVSAADCRPGLHRHLAPQEPLITVLVSRVWGTRTIRCRHVRASAYKKGPIRRAFSGFCAEIRAAKVAPVRKRLPPAHRLKLALLLERGARPAIAVLDADDASLRIDQRSFLVTSAALLRPLRVLCGLCAESFLMTC